MGSYLEGLDKAKGGVDTRNHSQHNMGSEFKQAKVSSGMSDAQCERQQKTADIPDKEVEGTVKGRGMPAV
ncbi:MAG: hypothetical protein GY781_02680 [Gammaproteobacteria bacterium]|nr:hypothetical protein [Gammaproteobacteria bacterium]